MGGRVFDSISPPSSSRESHVVCTVFLHHMTCRFFFSPFKHFSAPPPLPPCCVSAAPAKEERQNSCGSAERFPINQGIMQAGNSNKMQMSGGARLQPNTSPSTSVEQPDGEPPDCRVRRASSDFSPSQQFKSPTLLK